MNLWILLTCFLACLLANVVVEAAKEWYWRRRSERASVQIKVEAKKLPLIPVAPSPKPSDAEDADKQIRSTFQPEHTKL